MPRVKRGTIAIKRRRKVLRAARGFRHGRSKKERLAREALFHAGAHALAHRRAKKNDFRRLWQIQIGAAARQASGQTISYSRFIDRLKKKQILLDRKILAQLAQEQPAVFNQLIDFVK